MSTPRRRFAGLSRADWGVVVAALLLDASLLLPWLSFGGSVVRPVELLGEWVLVVIFVPIVLATIVAARLPYTRWLSLVPLMVGVGLLGVLAGVVATVLVLNPLLASLPWQDATEVIQTLTRLASVARLQADELERLNRVVSRFALEPQISIQVGCWLFLLSALGLIVVGYRKIVESFSSATPAHTELPTVTATPSVVTDVAPD